MQNEGIMSDYKNFKALLPALAVLLIVGLTVSTTMHAVLIDKVDADDTKPSVPVIKKGEKISPGDNGISGSQADLADCADGSYIGTGTGYAGFIKVRVTIKSHAITSLKIVENEGDDPPYLSRAKRVLTYIMDSQSTDVDTVSGATYSSNGIISAVNDALSQAAGKAAKKSDTKKRNKNKSSGQHDSSLDGKKFKDGIYTGTGMGFRDDIHVEVTISGNRITRIAVTKHKEDQPYMRNAMKLISGIIAKQSINVDTVSGATYSSKGIITAVKDALKKAVTTDEKEADTEDEHIESDPDTGYTAVHGMYNDGTYKGLARGYKSTFQATVTVKNESIYSIDITHGDDEEYYSRCTGIIDRIIRRQTTDGIDTVSGCTLSSNAILSSVAAALAKAKK